MELKSIANLDLDGKRVLFRVEYNVPIEKRGKKRVVSDATRIRVSIPTLRALLKRRCKIIICTWLGRPGGRPNPELTLDPVAKELSRIIKLPVKKLDATVGPAVEAAIAKMKPRDIVMLENVRFNTGEEERKATFARQLASLADAVVFDAFGQSHRDAPSVSGILSLLPCAAGYDFINEINTLQSLITKPAYPFVVILGGAKISDKVAALLHLLKIADCILLGGAMVHNFLKAQGVKIGGSLVEEKIAFDKQQKQQVLTVTEEIIRQCKDIFVTLEPGYIVSKLILPKDLIAAQRADAHAQQLVVDLENGETIPWDWTYLDIGPKTIAYYTAILKKAKTIFWNGPLGYIELEPFTHGSFAIAQSIVESGARSIVGGGDTETLLKKLTSRQRKKIRHISNGGGAVLDVLAGKELPVMRYLTL